MEQHRETEAQQVERFAVENLEIEGRGQEEREVDFVIL